MRGDPSGARLRGARAGGGVKEERGASGPGALCWGAQSGEEGVVERGGSSREGRGAQVSGTLFLLVLLIPDPCVVNCTLNVLLSD